MMAVSYGLLAIGYWGKIFSTFTPVLNVLLTTQDSEVAIFEGNKLSGHERRENTLSEMRMGAEA